MDEKKSTCFEVHTYFNDGRGKRYNIFKANNEDELWEIHKNFFNPAHVEKAVIIGTYPNS